MASLFGCQPDTAKPSKSCVLYGVSPCRDQVSHVICNEHSEIFGLINKTASYRDGNNNDSVKIVTYISATNNIHIPLFMDSTSKISLGEIQSFSLNAYNANKGINSQKLAAAIACLMGLDSSVRSYCPNSWFDDTNSALIIRNNTGEVQYFQSLPQLHKCLFHFAIPSIISQPNSSKTFIVPNISLTRSDSSDSYVFVVPKKDNILKYTEHPDCVSTPVVLDAIRHIPVRSRDKTFTQIGGNFGIC